MGLLEILWVVCLLCAPSVYASSVLIALWMGFQAIFTVLVIAKWAVKYEMWRDKTEYATRRDGKSHL